MKIPFYMKIYFLLLWPFWIVILLSVGTLNFVLNMIVGITELFVHLGKDWIGYLDILNFRDYYKLQSVGCEIKFGHEIYVRAPKIKPIELKDDKETTNNEQNIR